MASQAYLDFINRLDEVNQLLEAHSALTRLRRAEAALIEGGQNLANVGEAINHLVTDPGRGRRYEVHALNSASIALLSAHFQGFNTDIFSQCVSHLLQGHVEDPESVVEFAPTRGNPNQQNINKLFSGIGFPRVVEQLSWRNCSNDSVRKRLRELNELRNKVVHGKSEPVTKARVKSFYNFVLNFAYRFDRLLHQKLLEVTGNEPWQYPEDDG